MKCGSSLFFSPWVGNKYNQGISGKKILVLGASHYCNHKGDCCYFFDCTNEHLKDSSLFDKKCPYTDNEGGWTFAADGSRSRSFFRRIFCE